LKKFISLRVERRELRNTSNTFITKYTARCEEFEVAIRVAAVTTSAF